MSDDKSILIEDIALPIYTRIFFKGYVDGKEVLLHATNIHKGFIAIPNVGDVVTLTRTYDQPIVENKRMQVSHREFIYSDRPYEVFVKLYCSNLASNGPSFWSKEIKNDC